MSIQINALIDSIKTIIDFDIWLQTINHVRNLLDHLSDDDVNELIKQLIGNTWMMLYNNPRLNEKRDEIFEMINDIFITYMNYLSIDTILDASGYFYALWKSVIDYRPDIASQILNEKPHWIEILVEQELYKYREYHVWFNQYLPLVITFYDSELSRLNENYQERINFVKEQIGGPEYNFLKMNIDELGNITMPIHHILTYPDQIKNIKGYIKKYYYILGQIKNAIINKSDLDKEWTIRYFIRADDYIDAQELREKLFRQYYLKKDMSSMSIPINLDEETIIQLGNYIKNLK